MKRLLAITVVVLGMASQGWALSYSGSISNKIGDGTLIGTSLWNDDKTSTFADITLSWVVDNTTNAGLWTYAYTFTADEKSVSHIILELSSTFTADNFKAGTTANYVGPQTYASFDSSNTDLNGTAWSLWGVKWNELGAVTIVSSRAPMWGDFYVRDGKNVWFEEIQVWVPTTYKPNGTVLKEEHWETQTIKHQDEIYAYSKMFGNDPADIYAVGNGNNGGWVLVPDTLDDPRIPPQEVPVPEPGTLVLLGSGLLGMALYGRRRIRN